MAQRNPYEPPGGAPTAGSGSKSVATAAELAAWRAVVARGALLLLVVDASRALLWRSMSAVATAYPGSVHTSVGSQGLNVAIQLVGALGVLGASFLVTRAPAGRPLGRTAILVRAIATVTVLAHMARLGLVVGAIAVDATLWLGPLTILCDGAVIGGCIGCVASVFAVVESPRAVAWTRALGLAYVSATAAAAVVSANATIRACRVLPLGSGSLVRTVVSLLFVVLAIAAFRLVRQLANVADPRA